MGTLIKIKLTSLVVSDYEQQLLFMSIIIIKNAHGNLNIKFYILNMLYILILIYIIAEA